MWFEGAAGVLSARLFFEAPVKKPTTRCNSQTMKTSPNARNIIDSIGFTDPVGYMDAFS